MGDMLQELIETNGEHDWRNYSQETISEFKTGLEILKTAYVYVQRIDWLVSGDDSESTFHVRLNEDLNELNK
jgi:hypothetical protein